MNLKPITAIEPGHAAPDDTPYIKPTGFREYDARWLFDEEINLEGLRALGAGLGTFMANMGVKPEIVTGYDYRSYSQDVAQAVNRGLMEAGVIVHDIGLALTPTAYFAQFDLDIVSVAMITASHNENGWTGVKMGIERPLTLGPEDMQMLKEIVLSGKIKLRPGGKLIEVEGMAKRYISDLTDRPAIARGLKVVVACGNGTAGAFAPEVLEGVGCEVVALDCELDHSFPKYNPNPEDLKMLEAVRAEVLASKADVGLAFDGDGDRCGVVDNEGNAVFADKVGVLLARDISANREHSKFVADVKSTGLFMTDPVLKKNNAVCEYWKTGHSYIKRRTHQIGALAGFEKSGHYFFNPPLGRGYDDGLISAMAVLDMLASAEPQTMAGLVRSLPKTWSSPTMSPHCRDEDKYTVVDKVTAHYQNAAARSHKVAGQNIRELITVNGVRIVLRDGTWGLVRASSNKPELVVVVESPTSKDNMKAMFKNIDMVLSDFEQVGEYNQKL